MICWRYGPYGSGPDKQDIEHSTANDYAMLQQLESMGKAVRIQEEPAAASPAVVKAARKEKPVCASVGAALTILHRLF